jgi:hypothetical protein
MHLFFFYDANDGSGAVGEIKDRDFLTHYVYSPGSFAKHWYAIADLPLAGGRLFFYDLPSRSAVVGPLTPNGFVNEKLYEPGSFGSWTRTAGVRLVPCARRSVDAGELASRLSHSQPLAPPASRLPEPSMMHQPEVPKRLPSDKPVPLKNSDGAVKTTQDLLSNASS